MGPVVWHGCIFLWQAQPTPVIERGRQLLEQKKEVVPEHSCEDVPHLERKVRACARWNTSCEHYTKQLLPASASSMKGRMMAWCNMASKEYTLLCRSMTITSVRK